MRRPMHRTRRLLEEWKDEAAVEAHNATPHFTEICPALGAFLKEPMQVTTYTQVL